MNLSYIKMIDLIMFGERLDVSDEEEKLIEGCFQIINFYVELGEVRIDWGLLLF